MYSPCLLCKEELPFQQMERGDAHTMRTCLCPSQLPSHRGLHQRWRHSEHLKLNICIKKLHAQARKAPPDSSDKACGKCKALPELWISGLR